MKVAIEEQDEYVRETGGSAWCRACRGVDTAHSKRCLDLRMAWEREKKLRKLAQQSDQMETEEQRGVKRKPGDDDVEMP